VPPSPVGCGASTLKHVFSLYKFGPSRSNGVDITSREVQTQEALGWGWLTRRNTSLGVSYRAEFDRR